MKLIAGLGNIGNNYAFTRHNAGFMVVDKMALDNNATFKEVSKLRSLITNVRAGGEEYLLIKPTTYMNLSGEAIQLVMNYYKIPVSDLLVVYDDLSLELGKIRYRANGSDGGHNGIKNIIECLGTKEFTRLKIGISNNKNYDTKDYVLGKFSKEESDLLTNIYSDLENIIDDFINLDTDKLKQKYNSMNK